MVWVDYSWSSFSHCLHYVSLTSHSSIRCQVDNPPPCSHTVGWGQLPEYLFAVPDKQVSLSVTLLFSSCYAQQTGMLNRLGIVATQRRFKGFCQCSLELLLLIEMQSKALKFLVWVFEKHHPTGLFARPYFCFCVGIFISKSRYRYTRYTTEAQTNKLYLVFLADLDCLG